MENFLNSIENFLRSILTFNSLNFQFYPGITKENTWIIFLDIILVALFLYSLYLLVKDTRAISILWGILFLGIIIGLGKILGLNALNWLLGKLFLILLVAIPVVFQPELRRALEKLGRTRTLGNYRLFQNRQLNFIVEEIAAACEVLSKNKIGALIVFGKKTGLSDIIETGTKINAEISRELILNLFYPNSPLHDGAVVILQNKIAAAGCILPLSESEQTYRYGTRHRAALGLAETSDAVILVVSEERGVMALISGNKFSKNIPLAELKENLLKSLKK